MNPKTELDRMMRPMNPLNDPNRGDYAPELHYHSQMVINMNPGSKEMIGPSHKMSHRLVVEAKAIDRTSLTERRNELGPYEDVNKNFARQAKVHEDPQPNDFGEPASRSLYKKAGKVGVQKGGAKYGKG